MSFEHAYDWSPREETIPSSVIVLALLVAANAGIALHLAATQEHRAYDLSIVCAIAFADRRAQSIVPSPALALFCLWSLLSVFQLQHNLLLMLPAFVYVILQDDERSKRVRFVAAGVIQVVMLDVPGHASGI